MINMEYLSNDYSFRIFHFKRLNVRKFYLWFDVISFGSKVFFAKTATYPLLRCGSRKGPEDQVSPLTPGFEAGHKIKPFGAFWDRKF